jgi:hypothetical protein
MRYFDSDGNASEDADKASLFKKIRSGRFLKKSYFTAQFFRAALGYSIDLDEPAILGERGQPKNRAKITAKERPTSSSGNGGDGNGNGGDGNGNSGKKKSLKWRKIKQKKLEKKAEMFYNAGMEEKADDLMREAKNLAQQSGTIKNTGKAGSEAAEAAGEVTQQSGTIKNTGKGVAEIGVKKGAKFLPIIGTAIGLVAATEAAYAGNYDRAALEVVGASEIPYVATAADATMLTADIKAATTEAQDSASPEKKSDEKSEKEQERNYTPVPE